MRTRRVTGVPELTDLERIGRAAGLDAFGVAGVEPLVEARAAIADRIDRGLHAGMAFTFKNPARSTTPADLVPGCRALVVGARSYFREEPSPPDGDPVARVARYAWRDHYADLKGGLGAVAEVLRDAGWRTRILADDNSVVDRSVAHRAGIGWFGKNANLLLPGRGSWFVLGAVATDAPLQPASTPVADGCGPCRRCLDGCPTDAILAPGVVDARRCLAWLVQAEGTFPVEHRLSLGDRIYGCDDCQEVCPPNRRRAPDPRETDALATLDPRMMLELDDLALMALCGRWYIPRRDPAILRRNALLVLANVGDGADQRTIAVIRAALAHPAPIVRSHAVWAARRLGLDPLLSLVADDDDPDVRAELTLHHDGRS